MMKIYRMVIIAAAFFSNSQVSAQEQTDSASLLAAFKNGKTSGHFRSFFMATDNAGPLTDYYALALGGGLKYQTKSFKGFQAGIGGFFIWNLASSDLTKPDKITNVMNRYEIGQFDQTNPSNKRDLQRLEDLFIRYSYRNSFIQFGKQVIKTPFINPQDGRMRPTGVQGAWVGINEFKNTKIELAWLTHMSPRGTLKWYRGSSSAGVYPSGFSIDGEKSDYKNNLDSKGIGIAGITYSINKRVKLQAWDHYVENIFNTILAQADGEFALESDKKITGALQYIHQHALHDGGNPDPSKTYFHASQQVNIYGIRIGYHWTNSAVRFNYSRITKDGRFLFPREWGREPLFTFLARERNEGLGNVNAVTLTAEKKLFGNRLFTELGAGYYDLPDIRAHRLNKYGMPSYYQFVFDAKYSFEGFLSGLNLELLYLYKGKLGSADTEWNYLINKVNMHQLNFILNYYF